MSSFTNVNFINTVANIHNATDDRKGRRRRRGRQTPLEKIGSLKVLNNKGLNWAHRFQLLVASGRCKNRFPLPPPGKCVRGARAFSLFSYVLSPYLPDGSA